MLEDVAKIPEHVAVSPMTLWCPRCKAKPGEACDMLDDLVELIHLERIEAAITMTRRGKKSKLALRTRVRD